MENERPENQSEVLLFQLKQELDESVPEEYVSIAKEIIFVSFKTPYAAVMNRSVGELPSECYEYRESSFGSDEREKVPVVKKTMEYLKENKNALTSFGKLISEKMASSRIIDLAAGDPNLSIIQNWSQIFKAKEYIGIDKFFPETAEEDDGFKSYRLKDESLLGLAKFPDESAEVIHVSGFEHGRAERKALLEYFDTLIYEMSRVLKPGGIVVTGPGSEIWLSAKDLFEENGFEEILIAVDHSHKREIGDLTKASRAYEQESTEYNKWAFDITKHGVLYRNGYVVYQKTNKAEND